MNYTYDFSGQRALVTGASGFVGSHLCRRLGECGAEVHGVSRHPPSDSPNNVRWWDGDAADIETVRDLFQQIKPDTVFHLASHVMGAPDLKHVLPTFDSNLHTTVNLLTAAAEVGCSRMIVTGSLAEPEPDRGESFPSSPYAAAKWASSAYARMFHALYKVPVVLARVFMVYGPAQRDLSKLIPYVALSVLRGEIPRITSGTRLIDWVYVTDVVEGFLAAALTPGIDGCTIELGSGHLISIREIVQRVIKSLGSPVEASFGTLPDRPLEPVRVANIDYTYEKIRWKPFTSLKTGLRQTVDWYRVNLWALTHTGSPSSVDASGNGSHHERNTVEQ